MNTLKSSTVFLLLAATAVSAAAQSAPADAGWHNTLGTYMWLPAQSGSTTIKGMPVDVDTSVGDAWDALSNLDGALLLFYEGGTGPWSVLSTIFYIDLEGTKERTLTTITLEAKTTLAEIAGAYAVSVRPVGKAGSQTASLLAGVRYTDMSTEATIETPAESSVSTKTDESWLDLFVGGRWVYAPNPQWRLTFRGDIGGFGIGDSSDLTWQLGADAGWVFSKNWTAHLGWRWLDYDYDTGSGDTAYAYDVLMNGPYLGITYSW